MKIIPQDAARHAAVNVYRVLAATSRHEQSDAEIRVTTAQVRTAELLAVRDGFLTPQRIADTMRPERWADHKPHMFAAALDHLADLIEQGEESAPSTDPVRAMLAEVFRAAGDKARELNRMPLALIDAGVTAERIGLDFGYFGEGVTAEQLTDTYKNFSDDVDGYATHMEHFAQVVEGKAQLGVVAEPVPAAQGAA